MVKSKFRATIIMRWSSKLILGQLVVLMATSNPEKMTLQLLLDVDLQKFDFFERNLSPNTM